MCSLAIRGNARGKYVSIVNDYCATLGRNNLFSCGPRLNFGICVFTWIQSTYEEWELPYVCTSGKI